MQHVLSNLPYRNSLAEARHPSDLDACRGWPFALLMAFRNQTLLSSSHLLGSDISGVVARQSQYFEYQGVIHNPGLPCTASLCIETRISSLHKSEMPEPSTPDAEITTLKHRETATHRVIEAGCRGSSRKQSPRCTRPARPLRCFRESWLGVGRQAPFRAARL